MSWSTENGVTLEWSKSIDEVFNQLEEVSTSMHILDLHEPNQPYTTTWMYYVLV